MLIKLFKCALFTFSSLRLRHIESRKIGQNNFFICVESIRDLLKRIPYTLFSFFCVGWFSSMVLEYSFVCQHLFWQRAHLDVTSSWKNTITLLLAIKPSIYNLLYSISWWMSILIHLGLISIANHFVLWFLSKRCLATSNAHSSSTFLVFRII